MGSPAVGDFVWVKHSGEIARVIDVYTYEWSLEWPDGSTGRLEADDFLPVSVEVLWHLATAAPKTIVNLVVRAASDE